MIAISEECNQEGKQEQLADVNSRATVDMLKDSSMMPKMGAASNIRIQNADDSVVKARSQEENEVNLTNEIETVQLNHIFHVPNRTHKFLSVSTFCDADHTVWFTKDKCREEGRQSDWSWEAWRGNFSHWDRKRRLKGAYTNGWWKSGAVHLGWKAGGGWSSYHAVTYTKEGRQGHLRVKSATC